MLLGAASSASSSPTSSLVLLLGVGGVESTLRAARATVAKEMAILVESNSSSVSFRVATFLSLTFLDRWFCVMLRSWMTRLRDATPKRPLVHAQ